MSRIGPFLVTLALSFGLSLSARADQTIYLSTGPFNGSTGFSGGTADFGPGDSFYGTITFASPLPPSAFFASPPISSFSLTMGNFTITDQTVTNYADIEFSTDSSGNLTNWYLDVENADGTYLYLDGLNNNVVETLGPNGSQFYRELGPGAQPFSFTPPPAPTPEPSSLVLLGTGFFGALGTMRRRFSR